MNRPALSLVVPVYNEELCLEEFFKRCSAMLSESGTDAEFVFINDGSTDGSARLLKDLSRKDPSVRVIHFSRNFGHQIAIKAGIDHAQGRAVVIIDSDLQDPPEVIPDLIAKWREGYEVVFAMREKREGESWFKRWTAELYYRLMRRLAHVDIPLDSGDFRLIDERVADCLKNVHERNPYMRGLISWTGFRQIGIPIQRRARFAGHTKYSFKKMAQLAWNGITHFSFLPLQLCTVVGFLTALFSLLFIGQSLYAKFYLNTTVPGWTSIMIAVLFLGSVQLITLGIIGSYLGRIYDESRQRPLYLISSREGFEELADVVS